MNPKRKHQAALLAVLLAIPFALLARANEEKAVKPEKGEKAKAPAWIRTPSARTGSTVPRTP